MKGPLPQAEGGKVLADWVTDCIREAVLQGHFESGEKIDQARIGEELEVSRTPIREALKRLESEGFVDIRPHRGAFITLVTHQDIQDIYEIRALLEAQVVRKVTPIIPDSVLDELERSCDKSQALLDAGMSTEHEHFSCDTIFHNTMLSYVENQLLKDVLESLKNRTSMIRRFALHQPGPHIRESLKEHRAILRVMCQRDADRAAHLMDGHLRNSSARIQELVTESSQNHFC